MKLHVPAPPSSSLPYVVQEDHQCVPFNSTPANVCSRYYRQGVDTFFLPNGRSESELMALAEQDVTNPLNVVRESCL